MPRDECAELTRFRSLLSQAHALCASRGIDLVVAFVPAKFRVYRGFCEFDRDSPCLEWGVDGLARALEHAVHEVSPEIGFVDLIPPFLGAAADGSLLYLPDDTHWSPEGHRLAASVLAKCLAGRRGFRGPRVARVNGHPQ